MDTEAIAERVARDLTASFTLDEKLKGGLRNHREVIERDLSMIDKRGGLFRSAIPRRSKWIYEKLVDQGILNREVEGDEIVGGVEVEVEIEVEVEVGFEVEVEVEEEGGGWLKKMSDEVVSGSSLKGEEFVGSFWPHLSEERCPCCLDAMYVLRVRVQ